VTLNELAQIFDNSMPKAFDRDVAFEMMRELDGDKDGKLTYKDFYECMKF